MAKLTEEMVIARSRQSDLSNIKKLNCWGSDLSDISIIRRMKGVEVLALSVNQISTLADFEECERLQELYLRKNNIPDLSELVYIQNLPNLRSLWLEENPCVDRAGPNYRALVLRVLPNLSKLDNVDVTPEEVNESFRALPNRADPVYEEPESQHQKQPQRSQQSSGDNQRQSSPTQENLGESSDNVEEEPNVQTGPSSEPPSPIQRSPGSNPDVLYGIDHTANTNHNLNHGCYREFGTLASSISTQSMKEYYQSDYNRAPNGTGQYRYSQSDLTEWDEQQESASVAGARGNGRRSMGPTDRDVPGSFGGYGRNGGARDD